MIESQYNETVTIKRLENVDGTPNQRNYQEHLTGVNCCIQPLDNQISGDTEGGFGKEWLMFCEPCDIQEGDRVIRGEKEYRITAIESLNFMGNTHMEVNIRIFES